MASLAIGAYQRPAEDYLDPAVLADSYQAAYCLLFARFMVDVLKTDCNKSSIVNGTRSYETQAVFVVSGFAYAVEGLFGAIALLTVCLMVLT
jgi:hypothetical protein